MVRIGGCIVRIFYILKTPSWYIFRGLLLSVYAFSFMLAGARLSVVLGMPWINLEKGVEGEGGGRGQEVGGEGIMDGRLFHSIYYFSALPVLFCTFVFPPLSTAG